MTGLVMDAATKFAGRAFSRRLKRAIDERMTPAMAARQERLGRQEDMLQEKIAIAARYPDLRACLSDQVVFLAGGRRMLPMPRDLSGLTMAQADAIVAQLRAD